MEIDISDGMRRWDYERVACGEATQQSVSAMRRLEGGMGRSKKTRRGNATTSWCNELTRGWRKERTVRVNATTSWRNMTTWGQRNESTTRGDATTSWHDETMRGWRYERQHNLVVFWVQTESITSTWLVSIIDERMVNHISLSTCCRNK